MWFRVTHAERVLRPPGRMYPPDDTEARLRLASGELTRLRVRLHAEVEWSRTLRRMIEESQQARQSGREDRPR